MNYPIRRVGVVAMLLCCSVAFAQSTPKPADSKKASASAPIAGSAEAQVAARFAEKSGGQKPDQVFKGRGGLYEVLIGGQIYYVDPEVSFVLAGRMFDPATREDLTQKRLDVALKVDFKSLPLANAVKTVRGDGSRVLVTFEDPNCGYCKRLWQNMAELKNARSTHFFIRFCRRIRWTSQRPSGVRRIAPRVGTSTWCRTSRHRPQRLIARTRWSKTLHSAATSESTARQPLCS